MDIAVITHAQDSLFLEAPGRGLGSRYLLGPILGHLAGELGHHVQVYRGLNDEVRPADFAIMHVDLTQVPEDYVAFGASFPFCVNLGVTDISKRSVSAALLGDTEPWDGPVIVKTDCNFGGRPELRLDADEAASFDTPFGYRIYETREAVPAALRLNPDLVIEKFLPERDGDFYVTRFYLFAGEAEHCGRVHARDPIVKGESALGFEFCEIPAAMRERRIAMGLQFGKLDFVMHEGEPVLIDVNKTPATIPVTEQSTWPRTYAEALLACVP